MKYVSVDVETSGVKWWKGCQVLSLGAVIDDMSSPVSMLPRYHALVAWDDIYGEPFALGMNAEIIKKIADKKCKEKKVKPEDLGRDFAAFLVDNGYKKTYNPSIGEEVVSIVVGGKNFGSFDRMFLMNHPEFDKSVSFVARVYDPCSMWHELDDERPPDLATCLSRAGIEKTVTHDALDDAIDVVQCIRADMRRKLEYKKLMVKNA